VPSTTGSSPSWPSQPARLVSRWCSRPHALARAVPYRVVWVSVVTAGAGQVWGSASLSAAPCRSGRPLVPAGRGGAGQYMTRSLRSRPSTSTGRSRSSQASLVRSYPASKITRMSGSPSCQCPAATRSCTTSRTWAAVTPVASSSGPSRTASSGLVHDVRPGSSAATSEYGQPGIICAFPRPRAVGVGPGRPAGIAPGGFPRPARRTRRACLHATGAPRALPAGLAGCWVRLGCPRGRDVAAAVAVAGDRHG